MWQRGRMLGTTIIVATMATATAASGGVPLAASAGAGTSPCSASTESEDPIVIALWTAESFDSATTVEALVAEFNVSQSGILIEYSNRESGNVLEDIRNAEDLPDVAAMGLDVLVPLSESGLTIPVSACIGDEDPLNDALLRSAADAFTYRESLQALPFKISTPVLYFDQNRFVRAGIDPTKPPTTVNDLVVALETLSEAGESSGLTVQRLEWLLTEWVSVSEHQLVTDDNGRSPGGSSPPVSNVTASSIDDVVAAITRLRDRGLLADDIGGDPSYGDLLRLTDPVNPTSAAIHTSGSASLVYTTVESGGVGDVEVGIAPLPTFGSRPGGLVGGTALWLFDSTPDRVAASWAVIEYLSSAEAQARIGTLGYAPNRADALDNAELQDAWTRRPGLRVAHDSLQGDDVSLGPAVGPHVDVVGRLRWLTEDLLRGRDPDDAIADANEDIDRHLATYQRVMTAD